MSTRDSILLTLVKAFSVAGLLGCCCCLICRQFRRKIKTDEDEVADEEEAFIDENNSTLIDENGSTKNKTSSRKQVSSLISRFETLTSQDDEVETEIAVKSSFSLPKSNLPKCKMCQEKIYPTDGEKKRFTNIDCSFAKSLISSFVLFRFLQFPLPMPKKLFIVHVSNVNCVVVNCNHLKWLR